MLLGSEREWEMGERRKDVLVAAYLFEDLARNDFEAVLTLAEHRTIRLESALLVQKHGPERLRVIEAGTNGGRADGAFPPSVWLAVGLLSPTLLAQTSSAVSPDVVDAFEKYRTVRGIATAMESALPDGSGGIVTIYDSSDAGTVDLALPNAIKRTVMDIDAVSATTLKNALAQSTA